MSINFNQFIKSTVKIDEPYNLVFLFSKPTALELIKIQSHTSQLFAGINENQDPEKLIDLIRYQTDTIKNYVTEITGFVDDDGKAHVVKNPSELSSLCDHLPVQLLALVFNGFLQTLIPTDMEKKS